MNAISMSIVPFDAYGAYQREREAHQQTYDRLLRSNMLLRMACDRGKVIDPEAVREFLRECGK